MAGVPTAHCGLVAILWHAYTSTDYIQYLTFIIFHRKVAASSEARDIHVRCHCLCCLALKHTRKSETGLQESEDLDKPLPVFGDAASSVTSSPIRSFACDFADTALDDFGDDWAALENTGSASGSDMPSPRVLQCSTPARVTLVSFMLLDFDAFSEDDGVE